MKQITKDTVLKQGDKTYSAIEVLDESISDFKVGDCVVHPVHGIRILQVDDLELYPNPVYYNRRWRKQSIVWIDKDVEIKGYYVREGKTIEVCKKGLGRDDADANCRLTTIIAATFDLEGVPKIELEDDIDWESLYQNHGIALQDARNKLLFRKGYKANKIKWTDEDAKRIFEAGITYQANTNNGKDNGGGLKSILQSLTSIKEILVDENFKIISYE